MVQMRINHSEVTCNEPEMRMGVIYHYPVIAVGSAYTHIKSGGRKFPLHSHWKRQQGAFRNRAGMGGSKVHCKGLMVSGVLNAGYFFVEKNGAFNPLVPQLRRDIHIFETREHLVGKPSQTFK